jgi:hypothetical protein
MAIVRKKSPRTTSLFIRFSLVSAPDAVALVDVVSGT